MTPQKKRSFFSTGLAFCLGLAVASFGFYALYPVAEDAQRGSPVGKEYPLSQAIPSTPSDQLDVPEPTSNPLESGPAAPIEFSVQELDLGLRLINEAASGAITVANKGDVPVELLTVSPTCGCLSTNFQGRTSLAPGESLQVDVYHELRSMASSTSEGLRFVFLGYRLVTIPVKVEFTRSVKSDPSFVDLDRADSGELTLRALDGTPFRVLSILGQPLQAADGFDLATPAEVQRFRWDLSKFDKELCQSLDGEPMPKWMVIETDHPDSPLVDVRVRQYPCTMLDLPLRESRGWYLNTHRVILGQLEPGDSSVVSVPVDYLNDVTRVDPLELDVTGLKDLEVEIESYPGRDKLAPTTLNLRVRKKNDAAPGFGLERLLVRGTVSGLDQEIQLFHSYRPEN